MAKHAARHFNIVVPLGLGTLCSEPLQERRKPSPISYAASHTGKIRIVPRIQTEKGNWGGKSKSPSGLRLSEGDWARREFGRIEA